MGTVSLEDLLAGVDAVAETLRSAAAESDAQGRLADASIEALRSGGFWRMRLCQTLGGMELPIVWQIRVLAALAAEDASAAWCAMVANNAVGTLGATMPAAAIERIFVDGVPACSIAAGPGGTAVPTDGGFLLTGTWRLATGIHHAAWIHATALVGRDPSRVLPFAIPAPDVAIIDSWNVVGLAGTGSNDFKLDEYFLPRELSGNEENPYGHVRGRRRYDLADVEYIESYEHLAFALGIGRRAVRELRTVISNGAGRRQIADREMVQGSLGQLVIALQAIEALAYEVYDSLDARAVGEAAAWSTDDRYLPRALAVQATQIALQCTQVAFHRSGLAGLHRPNIFEKLLRDMSVAATHVIVDDTAFAAYAQHLIETGGPVHLRDRPDAGRWAA